MFNQETQTVDISKKDLKIAKRKKRNKTFLRILCGFLAVLFVFIGVTATITVVGLKTKLKKIDSFPPITDIEAPAVDVEENSVTIHSDKGLKVVQLTDVHLGGGWMSGSKDMMSLNAVAAMLTAEKPDLVILTGDIAYPVPFQAGTFNNKNGALLIAELMEQLGVYWAVCFGNHDTEAYSYYSREDIAEVYNKEDYPHCLFLSGPEDVDGVGNYVINIENSDGIITRSLFVMDSHSYIDGDILGIMWKYDNIHENQITWYESQINLIKEENAQAIQKLDENKREQYAEYAENVASSIFQHIPLTEYKTAWKEYIDNGEKDTENVKYIYGVAGESKKVVYSGIHEDGMFEKMLELGSTDTVFCGHDHYNNFSIEYKGIKLTYGKSVDFLAYPGIYKIGTQRGCTVINYAADGTVEYHAESYYQDKYNPVFEKEAVTMQEITNQSFVEE